MPNASSRPGPGSGTTTTKLLVIDAESLPVRTKSSLIRMFVATAGPGALGIGVPQFC